MNTSTKRHISTPALTTLSVLSILSLPVRLEAQDAMRTLDRPGEHHKHLTRDTVDHWKLGGRAGEVFRVAVSSREFDPVLEFVDADGAALQAAVDDPGSESKFLQRLPRDGKYEILVHGPDKRGGGNYRLHVERFFSEALAADRSLSATLDAAGTGHVHFPARRGEILVAAGLPVVEVIGPKGESLDNWGASYTVVRDGDHYARLRGTAHQRYRLHVHLARHREWEHGGAAGMVRVDDTIDGPGMDVWEFAGRVDDFRTIELEHPRHCHLRAVYVDERPVDGMSGPLALDHTDRPVIHFIPVHSKGDRQRLAVVCGRDGRFQIQVLSADAGANHYRLSFGDPSQPAPLGDELRGRLAIGDSAFYVFDTEPGSLLQVDVSSEQFDPLISLKRADGTNFGSDDDGGPDLSCRHSFLVTQAGLCRLHVTCYGNGGGGDYSLKVSELAIPALALDEAREAAMAGPGNAYWHFEGRQDQDVFVSLRSRTMDMSVSVRDPHGVEIDSDRDSGIGNDALAAIRLPADGRYTIVATNERGSGSCRIQVLAPDGL